MAVVVVANFTVVDWNIDDQGGGNIYGFDNDLMIVMVDLGDMRRNRRESDDGR